MKLIFRHLILSISFNLLMTNANAISQDKSTLLAWQWNCSVEQTKDLYQGKITWKTLKCNGAINGILLLENLNINVVYAPANDPDIHFIPYSAQTTDQLAKLPDIASSLSTEHTVIAGINGGYFYRSDVPKFEDNICYAKTFQPPSPNESMGDSLLQYQGKTIATNCAFWPGIAQNPRAALILSGTNPLTGKKAPYITLVKPNVSYEQADHLIPDAIGGGPNLISDSQLTVDNPDENLLPTLEFAANSAVGIINDNNSDPSQIVFFTVDGNNNAFNRHLPAMNAFEMADFMLHYLHVNQAISMDQGGSTTLYIANSDLTKFPLHVVSNSKYEPGEPRSADNIRRIYSGLFITVPKEN